MFVVVGNITLEDFFSDNRSVNNNTYVDDLC